MRGGIRGVVSSIPGRKGTRPSGADSARGAFDLEPHMKKDLALGGLWICGQRAARWITALSLPTASCPFRRQANCPHIHRPCACGCCLGRSCRPPNWTSTYYKKILDTTRQRRRQAVTSPDRASLACRVVRSPHLHVPDLARLFPMTTLNEDRRITAKRHWRADDGDGLRPSGN